MEQRPEPDRPTPHARRGSVLATILVLLITTVAAFLAGRWSDDDGPASATAAAPSPAALVSPAAQATVWTCSMHSQIRLSAPGKCPICGMTLIPASASPGKGGAVVLTPAAQARLGVQTVLVERRRVTKQILAVGKVQQNETAVSTVTSRVDGYVERLFVDYAGVEVKKGDHLVEIYSPDLLVAQHELLLAARSLTGTSLVDAARSKLILWGLTLAQVDKVIRTRSPTERVTLFSPVAGTVIEKNVVKKSAVKAGDALYRLVNLESVWVNLDIYEFELSWVQPGQPVEIRAEAFPGQVFPGRVTFISPLLDESTRTIKVRVNVSNRERKLKPGMFVNATIRVPLRSDGSAGPTGLEGQYTCPMHPEIVQPNAGACPVCGMPLERLPGRATAAASTSDLLLTVPSSAVLDSGTRRLVYVEDPPGSYRPVNVVLGPRSDDVVPVLSGLSGRERVVVRGAFLLDSEAQIRDLPSLLSTPITTATTGGAGSPSRRGSGSAHHQHGAGAPEGER